MLPDDPITRFFSKHLVPMLFTIQDVTGSRQFVVSAFVLSVLDEWFLITAGHCFREIEDLQSRGTKINSCVLVDTIGSDAIHKDPIPFVYEHVSPLYLSEDLHYDYGIIHLPSYYRQLLEANNVQSLTEDVWEKQPDEFNFYKLLGVPYELLNITPDFVYLTTTLIDIEPTDEWPKGVDRPSVPQFVGKVTLGKGLTNIAGTSGGPIFGFHENPPGKLKYWLTALQSRWFPPSRIVIGCPTKPLGQFLRSLIS
jgi:hypothetical protein